MELICPAGTPASLEAAVAAGADAVYCGFRDETNARNFPGLNFSRDELRKGIAFAHRHGVKVLVAINTFARAGSFGLWQAAIDDAVAAGADALILADLATLDYAARRQPSQRLHISVQAGAANPDAIRFYAESFGARRVVLPRVLSVMEIASIVRESTCETEVFVFGGLCVMEEGRCSLSSYATGQSPNTPIPNVTAASSRPWVASLSTTSARESQPAIRPCAKGGSRRRKAPATFLRSRRAWMPP